MKMAVDDFEIDFVSEYNECNGDMLNHDTYGYNVGCGFGYVSVLTHHKNDGFGNGYFFDYGMHDGDGVGDGEDVMFKEKMYPVVSTSVDDFIVGDVEEFLRA